MSITAARGFVSFFIWIADEVDVNTTPQTQSKKPVAVPGEVPDAYAFGSNERIPKIAGRYHPRGESGIWNESWRPQGHNESCKSEEGCLVYSEPSGSVHYAGNH